MNEQLPPLPYPQLDSVPAFTEPGYTAEQMRDYARAALAMSPKSVSGTSEREAFEAWCRKQVGSADDGMNSLYSAYCWLGWQARAALAANEKVPSRATDIATALALPGCERLKEWAEIGPVQRAAVEEFAYAMAAKVPADPCPGCRLGIVCRTPSCGRLKLRATPAPAPEADKKNEWRELALKFDGQRMAALSHLRMLLEHGEAHAEAVRKFLAEPPQATPAPEAEQSFNETKALILAMPLDDVRSYAIALLIQVRFLERRGSMSNAVTKMKQELAPAQAQQAGEPLTNIESPFNACQHREHCKGWKMVATDVVAKAKPEAQQAAEPLPCPFCGHVGLDFADGSTHRWGLASCAGCGATCGETRRAYPPDDKWHASAIKDWNTRAKPEAQQAAELATAHEARRQAQYESTALKGDILKIASALNRIGVTLTRTENGYEARKFEAPAQAQQAGEPLTNIESPFNACQHREHCKGWKMVATDVVAKAKPEAQQEAEKLLREAVPHAEWREKRIYGLGPQVYQSWILEVPLLIPAESGMGAGQALDRALGIGASGEKQG